MNLMMLLEMAAQGFGDRVAVQNGDETLTYSQLFRAAGVGAEVARASGAEHVAVLDVSSLAVPVSLFAGAWAGLPFVPLNYRLTGDELDALVARIAPSYLLTDSERAEGLAGRNGASVATREEFLERVAGGEPSGSEWPMDPDAIAVLLFIMVFIGTGVTWRLTRRERIEY